MRSRFRVSVGACLLWAGLATFATPAAAQTLEGRISAYNLSSLIGEPSSVTDAFLLRTYLTMDHIGGRNMAFRLDMRNELNVTSSQGAFNDRCDGSTAIDTGCSDRFQRSTVLGDLNRVAGIYDAFLELGGQIDKFTLVVGRKTYYDAGAITVDGIELRRERKNGRWGLFAGIAPNPETGIPDPQYQAAGGYWTLNSRRVLVRVGTAAELFDVKPDLVYLYTQDFVQLAKGLTASLIAQVDAVPFVSDRLIIFDLTYRTSPKYRIRLNVQRYRSLAFAERPLLKEQLLPPVGVIDETNLQIPTPKSFAEATTYHQVQGIFQATTIADIHAFASGGVRQRTIDGQVAPIFSIGAATYHPVRLPIQGMVRYRFTGGFDSTDHTISLALWRKLSFVSPISVGAGVDFIASKHTAVNETTNPNVSDSSTLIVANGFFQWDIARFAFYGSYEGALPSAATEANDKTSLEHLLVLGFTMRFGQASKRFF